MTTETNRGLTVVELEEVSGGGNINDAVIRATTNYLRGATFHPSGPSWELLMEGCK